MRTCSEESLWEIAFTFVIVRWFSYEAILVTRLLIGTICECNESVFTVLVSTNIEANKPSLEIASRSISSDLDECSDFFIEIPSTSSESLFSVSDVSEPRDPRFVFVSEFVLLLSMITDFDRVTTITTSARGDCEYEREKNVKTRSRQLVADV